MNLPLKKNSLLNAIFVDWIASRRVDPGHQNAESFQNLPYCIVGRGTVTDRRVSQEILKEKWVFAQTLNRLGSSVSTP